VSTVTGCWGAGLARWLRQEGFVVVEVDRPNRRIRRRQGKSDTIDALAAARAVQSGEASGTPKAADGDVEAIRMLRVALRSAVKARTQAANQLHALVVTAPMSCAINCAGGTT
jgi:transposase